jgi:hypothetical protein
MEDGRGICKHEPSDDESRCDKIGEHISLVDAA